MRGSVRRRAPQPPRPGEWWLHLWGAVALAGTVVAWLDWGPVPTLSALVVGLVGSAVIAAVLASQNSPISWRRVATHAALGGVAFVALPAVARVSVPLAALLVVLAAGTSPPVTSFLCRSRRCAPAATQRVPATGKRGELQTAPTIYWFIDREVSSEHVATMDTPALCRDWRRSYRGLQVARNANEKAEVVRVRQLLLDELHERHAAALEAWVDSGGRAASGPEKYLGDAGLNDAA